MKTVTTNLSTQDREAMQNTFDFLNHEDVQCVMLTQTVTTLKCCVLKKPRNCSDFTNKYVCIYQLYIC